jgi:predicted dehydrogenase
MTANRPNDGASRRDFLKTTAAAGAAAVAASVLPAGAYAAGSDVIKVGLIGCGGRGTGAADNVLHAAPNVTIWAMGDAFQDRLDGCRGHLEKLAQDDEVKKLGNKFDVTKDRAYVGLDAFEKVINSGADYIILATPPGFRPIHLKAAVDAGKNIFTEKPVAVDAPGYRSVIESYDKAKSKNLAIVAGTQRRHQKGYLETIKKLQDGAIGDIVGGRAFWNQGILWTHPREKGQTDLEYQMRNWYGFPYLCGDHIVEQHIHNLDVMHWILGATPISAAGMGGRQRSVPNPDDYGVIFDHFAVDYEFPNNVYVLSECRQISGCWDSVSEGVRGTKGVCQVNEYKINGKPEGSDKGATDPYVQEHTDLIASIRESKPLNELKTVAESTMIAIMGRLSTYTGKRLTWKEATESKEKLMPDKVDWDMKLPDWKPAVPGQTKFV